MKLKSIPLIMILLISVVLISGCTDSGQQVTAEATQKPAEQKTTATTSKEITTTTTVPTTTTTVTTTTQKPNDIIEDLASISVLGISWDNWDADADNDGMIASINFEDSKGDVISFENVDLTVDIRLYTSYLDDNFKEVKDRLVYSGTATIDSSADANMFIGGIRIPAEQIQVDKENDKKYGIIEVTVHTPKQGDFSARSELAKLYE